MEPLRGVAKKHKKELIDVEKRLSAPRDIATMELCLVQGNEEHRNFLSLIEGEVMHVVADKAVDQTSASACTSHPVEVSNSLTTQIGLLMQDNGSSSIIGFAIAIHQGVVSSA